MAAADKLGGDHPRPRRPSAAPPRRVEDGVLKVMSKMGISDVASYRGAQIFEAIGLAAEVVDRCFPGRRARRRHRVRRARAEAARSAPPRWTAPQLENPGYVKFRKGGEPHATTRRSWTRSTRRRPRTRFARR